jgi:hypothetical protein
VTGTDSRSARIHRTAEGIKRQHPDRSWTACLVLAEEIVSEYAADESAAGADR